MASLLWKSILMANLVEVQRSVATRPSPNRHGRSGSGPSIKTLIPRLPRSARVGVGEAAVQVVKDRPRSDDGLLSLFLVSAATRNVAESTTVSCFSRRKVWQKKSLNLRGHEGREVDVGLEGELGAPLYRVRGDRTLRLSPAASECWRPLPLVALVWRTSCGSQIRCCRIAPGSRCSRSPG